MKKALAFLGLMMSILFTVYSQNDQETQSSGDGVIKLVQVPGKFTKRKVMVKPGTYIFEMTNQNVGHDVGFVLVEKGKNINDPKNHIQTAYNTKAIGDGKTERSLPTVLQVGEYYYFCPLNPTATDNLIVVK